MATLLYPTTTDETFTSADGPVLTSLPVPARARATDRALQGTKWENLNFGSF